MPWKAPVRRAGASAELGARGIADFAWSALLGAAVGLAVAALEWVSVEWLLHELLHAPRWLQVTAPAIGLMLTWVVLQVGWQTTTSTSDDYIRAFHGDEELEPRRLGPKMGASAATIASGGALGLEGPAVYLGSTFGKSLGDRLERLTGTDRRALIVAGAAAGVSAVFKAPATGVLFALESPYRRDLARHALLPALVAAASAYLVFVLIVGDSRLLSMSSAEVGLRHAVGGAIAVGVLGGLVARGTSWVFQRAKYLPQSMDAKVRIPVAGVVMGLCVALSLWLVDVPAALGPGAEQVSEIVADAELGFWVLAALFLVRIVATAATLGGSGVGGVFIPLVVQGLILGRLVEIALDAPSTGLYPVIGLAAVLGAGYRTPLAAVMFVAETTGRAEFVIPALLATAVSQVLMGDRSVSSGQLDERKGRLERRLGRPASQVTIPDVMVLTPDELLVDVIDHLDGDLRTPALPVRVGDGCQLLVLNDIASAIFDSGMTATVQDVMRTIPTVHTDAPAIEAAEIMNVYNCAAIAVVDTNGAPIGIVSAESLAGLSDLDPDDLD